MVQNKIYILGQNFDFRPKFIFFPKFRFSAKISTYDQNLYFLAKFRFSTKILIFGQNFDFQPNPRTSYKNGVKVRLADGGATTKYRSHQRKCRKYQNTAGQQTAI